MRSGRWDRRNASERVGAIQELEVAGLGNGKIAIPPLIVALGDENARVRTAAAMALGPIGSDTSSSGTNRDAVRAAIMALLDALEGPGAFGTGRRGECPADPAPRGNACVHRSPGGHGDPGRTARRSGYPDSTGGDPDHGGPGTVGRGRAAEGAGRGLG